MNNINNLTSIFHLLIIALFLLGLSGCGYKAAPFYSQEESIGDENVKFIVTPKNEKKTKSPDEI